MQRTMEVRVTPRTPSGPSPAEVMLAARIREASSSRLLMAYVSSGLIFMLLPGTFLGVWNLLQISGRESVASVSPSWIQAHGLRRSSAGSSASSLASASTRSQSCVAPQEAALARRGPAGQCGLLGWLCAG